MESLIQIKQRTTPEEFSRALRAEGHLFWASEDRLWICTDYELSENILRNPAFSCDRSSFFNSRMPNIDPVMVKNFLSVAQKMMVMSDAPKHAARRKLAAFGVSDEIMDDFKPSVEKTVSTLIDKAASGKKQIEFVSEIAQVLPCIVLADLFCIPEKERLSFYSWSNHMTQFFGGASGVLALEADDSASHIKEYFEKLIAERRKSAQQDFLSVLLRHQEGLGLDDSEVISQAVMMLVAGQITTTDQMANNLFSLLTIPGALDQARASLNGNVIEELNRLDPAVTFIFRVVAQDIFLENTEIKQGDAMFISTHAVNRDPRVFEMPDQCRFDRSKNPHFSFGFGPHFCLGAKLARIQMSALFGQFLSRFSEPRIIERGTKRRHSSLAFSGFDSLALSI